MAEDYNIEEAADAARDRNISMGSVLRGNFTAGNRVIEVTLTEDEYKRIGNSEQSLKEMSDFLADCANRYITDF